MAPTCHTSGPFTCRVLVDCRISPLGREAEIEFGDPGRIRVSYCLLLTHPLFRGLLARVIGRVDVVDSERPGSGDLYHGLFRGPGIVVHACWHFAKTSGLEGLPLVHIELVAETDTEVTGDHRHELVGGMVMGRDFVF